MKEQEKRGRVRCGKYKRHAIVTSRSGIEARLETENAKKCIMERMSLADALHRSAGIFASRRIFYGGGKHYPSVGEPVPVA
jgi:hypothetical protein